ncbi:CZB domain-containing protein [Laribacter hongkongensis]|uniref:CZB domain-containing protein n=1 Tax=Laribacter hongkongensis TaxID=168471 RepID=UPI001FD4DEC0|nr:CZB domain-containing protein [Laribacter hongkongensis]
MPAAQFPDWLRHWKNPALWADIQNLYWKESDYPVFAAEVEHRNWVAQLVYAANEGIALPSCMLSGENLCAFGQWYHHQGQARYGGLPAFAAIEAPHCQLHAMADRIDHFWRNGTPDKGKALIPDILTVQTRMLEALHALQMAVAMKKHGP